MRTVAGLCLLLGLPGIVGAAEPKLVATLKGHEDDVSGVAFYRDSKTLATSSHDGTVRLWDVVTGMELETLIKRERTIYPLASALDGSALAACDGSGKTLLWFKGKKEPVVIEGDYPPRAFSPDGKLLATGPGVILWDVATRKERLRCKRADPGVSCFAFSPGGRLIATKERYGSGAQLLLWSVTTKQHRVVELSAHSEIWALAFAPDGRNVAVSRTDTLRGGAVAEIWDIHSCKGERLPGESKYVVSPLLFSPNGRLLAGARSDGAITLWDVHNRKEYKTLTGAWGDRCRAAFSPDGKFLAAGGSGGRVEVWEIPEEYRGTFSELPAFEPAEYVKLGNVGLRCLVLRPDGRELALGGDDGSITVWEVGKEAPRVTLRGHTKPIRALGYAPDGKSLVSAGVDGTPLLWDMATGEYRRSLRGLKGSVFCVAYAPDGKTIAAGDSDGVVCLWDADGKQQRTLEGHKGAVRCLAFTPDGKELLTTGSDGTVKQWDPATDGKATERLQVGGAVMTLALMRDGKALFLADRDGWVTRLDLAGGKSRRVFDRPVEGVQALAVSPDGKVLAVSSRLDSEARLYATATGKEVCVLDWHTDWVSGVAFSADGKFLVTASMDGSVRLWRPPAVPEK